MNEPVHDSGLDLRAIVGVAIGIGLMIVLAACAAWLAWDHWRAPDARSGPNGPLDFPIAGARLESAPTAERDAYFAEKERLLHSWQWVDRKAGVARIPIDDAMRIMAGQAGQAAQSRPAERRP